ncbi:tetratricopeptide repeat protein [Actinomycetospora chiangmaiensis]|uniref:tetratricopeptide repeat protein n=1 Tax=Actinomycetospora chiangmaiensis TaxID=402650 RepID=UPI00039A9E25|nr:tetratricopeptide repeat protein [Actinomycetospora chiangmaiensis]
MPDGAPLVFVWSGHARPSGGDLRLFAADSGPDDSRIGVREVVRSLAGSGAGQLLLIIDTCFSGEAAGALDVAESLWQESPPMAPHRWIGLLAACSAHDTARDKYLGELLISLLTHGPQDADLRRRWSVHNELIRGDDLCDAVVKEWDQGDYRPQYRSDGSAWFMLPNPLYQAGGPVQVVEHLLQAARGGTPSGEGPSFFTGRERTIERVVAWMRAGRVGVFIITGSAGIGKSAVLGRVVSLSNPVERDRLGVDRADEEAGRDRTDPGVGSVHAHVHARGLDADRLAAELDAQLTRGSLVLPASESRRNQYELLGALHRRATSTARIPVLVVDGLDESRGDLPGLVDLLRRLGRYATILVSTRRTPGAIPGSTVVDELAPADLVDLDTEECRDEERVAIRQYVMARLAGLSPAMDASMIAAYITEPEGHDHPFLLARLLTDQLLAHPVDTDRSGWRDLLASSVASAFEHDLLGVTSAPEKHRSDARETLEQPDAASLARGLLTALTWAFGAGFPEDEWMVTASVTTGVRIDRDHVSWLLDQLGRYVVQDGEAGVAVYRLAHQVLADHLRPFVPRAEVPFDPAAIPVTAALLDHYERRLGSGLAAMEPAYLWRYVWRHAAEAWPDSRSAMSRLAEHSPELRWGLGAAALEAGNGLAFWGRDTEALAPIEESLLSRRDRLAESPEDVDRIAELADALIALGAVRGALNRRADALAATDEAVTLYRRAAEKSDDRWFSLADALSQVGARHGELGHRDAALAAAEDAVSLYRRFAADDPALQPDRARALDSLGNQYSTVHRRSDALVATLSAECRFRRLVEEGHDFRAELGGVLGNLGLRYGDVGRQDVALRCFSESVEIFESLVEQNPRHRLALGHQYNNQGSSHHRLGAHDEAVRATEHAIAVYEQLVADHPAHWPTLAGAFVNLGIFHRSQGRHPDAVVALRAAVETYRQREDDDPERNCDLARALVELAISETVLNRHSDALAALDEAVGVLRPGMGPDRDPRPDLACALAARGACLLALGRRTDARAPLDEAIGLFRALADGDRDLRAEMAGALANSAACRRAAGVLHEAAAALFEATEIFRGLTARAPVLRTALARALADLGARLIELRRPTDARPILEEAVVVAESLDQDAPDGRTTLAGAFQSLGSCEALLGDRAGAIQPLSRAVGLLRALATDDPRLENALARALVELGVCHSAVNRHDLAVSFCEEAVRLCRRDVEVGPRRELGLARALVGLGHCLAARACWPDALAAITEATCLHRGLSSRDLSGVPELARAVALEGQYGDRAGEPTRDDAAWRAAERALPQRGRALLAVSRSSLVVAGSEAAAAWLAAALAAAPDLAPAVHEEARRHHDARSGAFEAAWLAAGADEVPDWMTVDRHTLTAARAWAEATTLGAERDQLASSPELVDTAADVAVDEALRLVEPSRATTLRARRATARDRGVNAAYRAPLAQELSVALVVSSPAEQLRLLIDVRTEADQHELIGALTAAARQRPDDDRVGTALGLATLASHPGTTDLLEQTVDAIADGTGFDDLLRRTAAGNHPAPVLGAVALAAACSVDADADAAVIRIYLAVVALDEPIRAQLLEEALDIDPQGVTAWTALLADLIPHRPGALPSLRFLSRPSGS